MVRSAQCGSGGRSRGSRRWRMDERGSEALRDQIERREVEWDRTRPCWPGETPSDIGRDQRGRPGPATAGGEVLRDDRRYYTRAARRPGRGPFYGIGPEGYIRSDERIVEEIAERLAERADIDPSDITVEVRQGVVSLCGTIDSRQSKFEVEEIVDDVMGVLDIDNRVRVQRRTGARRMSPIAGGASGGAVSC